MESATRIRRPLRKYFFPLSLLRNKSNIMAPTLYTGLRNEPNSVQKPKAKGKALSSDLLRRNFQYISSTHPGSSAAAVNLLGSTLAPCDSCPGARRWLSHLVFDLVASVLGSGSHAALGVHGAHGRLESVTTHDDGNGQLTRPLRDG